MIHCCQIVCVIEIDIGDRNILEIEIYVCIGIYCQLPNLFQTHHIVNRESCNSCPITQYILII